MKRNIALILLAVAMCVSLTACSRRDNNKGNVSPSPSASPNVTATPEASAMPEASASPEAGTMPDTEGGAPEMEAFRDAVKEQYGSGYLPSRQLTAAEVEELTGITSDMYIKVYAEVGEDDMSPDIFIAVHAAEGKADAVKEKLEVYQTQVGDKFTDEKFTDKIGAARVYQNGDYVFMMLLGDDGMFDGDMSGDELVSDAENAGDNMGDRFKNSADKAIEAIEELLGMNGKEDTTR